MKVGTTTATELLFLKYMMDSLRPGGRCGVIVPEGVLFGSTGAHKELRRQLIENNRVEAVLSLPGGVFQPYSGVKTSVLFFRKGGSTERVLFLHADDDGYKLDANHDTPIEADDLPALARAYAQREEAWAQVGGARRCSRVGREVVVCRRGDAARERLQPVGRPLPADESGAGRASRSARAAGRTGGDRSGDCGGGGRVTCGVDGADPYERNCRCAS